MSFKTTIQSILAIVALLGAFFGAFKYIDGRLEYIETEYARASDLRRVEQRLDYKITYDQYMSVQERIWKLEDRYGKIENMPDAVKDEYRELLKEKEMLKIKIDKLIGE